MKFVIALLLLSVSTSSFALLNATCIFDTYTSVYSSREDAPARAPMAQTMSIKRGYTTSETMSLDGKRRATNSSLWIKIESSKELSYFIGDSGEFLTIFHIGKYKLPSKGSYRSVILNSGYFQSGVMYGDCSLK